MSFLPSASTLEGVMLSLSRISPETRYVYAPGGSEAYIVLAHCFLVEATGVSSFSTTYDNPYTTIHGYRINTFLRFPGTNYYGSTSVEIPHVGLTIIFDPEVLLTTFLGEI